MASSEEVSGDEQAGIHWPRLPADWKFNALLLKIADEMTDEYLERAKSMFKGKYGLGNNLLSKITTPTQLLDALRNHEFLSKNNLLHLQAMFYHIGHMELFNMTVDFAQELGNAIHFSSPPSEPANGYKYIHFHIKGKDITQFTKADVESLRMNAALLMFVPPEFIVIAGIEPGSSLLITLMVPEQFVKYFEAAVHKKPAVEVLVHLGIDFVWIDGKKLTINSIEDLDIMETEEQTQLKTIHDELKLTKQMLEHREVECLMLKQRLETAPKKFYVSNSRAILIVGNNTEIFLGKEDSGSATGKDRTDGAYSMGPEPEVTTNVTSMPPSSTNTTISVDEVQKSFSALGTGDNNDDHHLTDHFDACILHTEGYGGRAEEIRKFIDKMPGSFKVVLHDDEEYLGFFTPERLPSVISDHCVVLLIVIAPNLQEDKFANYLRSTVSMAKANCAQVRPVLFDKSDEQLIPTSLSNTRIMPWYDDDYRNNKLRQYLNDCKKIRRTKEEKHFKTRKDIDH